MTVSAEEARAALAARLGEEAFAHCVAVAETATRLADAYDVDREDAYVAGLLHDWSREEGPDALLAHAASLGLEVTSVDEEVPYLLHARVGALAARDALPGLSEDVVAAIERHTTGTGGMSDLDMVVYLADMLEPGRAFEGVESLREEVSVRSLRGLYELAYAHSFTRLVVERRRVHPATVEAWNAIVSGREGR